MRGKPVVLGMICVLAAFLAACQFTPEDRELVRSFVEDWARSKNLHPVKEDGSLSWQGLWNAGSRYVTGSTGDPEADALIDAYEVISNLNQADVLMDQGRQNRDPNAMDQAISRRPGDWTYRSSRAALALEQGDWETYEQEREAAFTIADQRQIDPLWYTSQNIKDLQPVRDTLAAQGWPDAEQCVRVNSALAMHYQQRAQLTGSEADATAAETALNLVAACTE